MQYAIEIKNLCKQYPKFALQSVSFTLPMGYIMGFIGENGAGKTTVMKSMLHLVRPDSGTVLLLGQDATKENAALKQQIGVVLDTANFPQSFTTQDVHQMLKRVYSKWDGALYQQYLEQFHLPEKKKFKAKMNYADKLGVPYVVFLGDDEIAAGLVACKDMTSGEQTKLPFDATLSRIQEGLSQRNQGKVILEK